MKDCEKYQELISAMLDGELTETERRALEAHLAECPDCRAMYEAFAAVHAAVSETEELPETLHSGIMNRVNAAAGTGKKRGTVRYLRPALTAAACLAVVVGAVLTLRMGRPQMNEEMSDCAMTASAFVAEAEAGGGMMMYAANTMTGDAPQAAANGAEAVNEEQKAAMPDEMPMLFSGNFKSKSTADRAELPCVTVRVEVLTDSGFTAVVTSADSQFTAGETLLVTVDGETEPISFNLFPGGEYRVDYSDCGQTADGVPEIRAVEIEFAE